MRVQALRSKLAIEGLDEAVVRRLARPGEVEDDARLISPEVEVPRDELGSARGAGTLKFD